MDFAKVLAQLREELDNLDAAIECLERLNHGGRRRGRPPARLVPAKQPATSPNRKAASKPSTGSPKKQD